MKSDGREYQNLRIRVAQANLGKGGRELSGLGIKSRGLRLLCRSEANNSPVRNRLFGAGQAQLDIRERVVPLNRCVAPPGCLDDDCPHGPCSGLYNDLTRLPTLGASRTKTGPKTGRPGRNPQRHCAEAQWSLLPQAQGGRSLPLRPAGPLPTEQTEPNRTARTHARTHTSPWRSAL